MNAAKLMVVQTNYVNKSFWRNPSRAFFTFAFPLLFLVIFTSLLGNYTIHIGSLNVKSSTYYVAAMASFGVITACYTNMGISIPFQRDAGILKRIDGSPLPKPAFMGSRVLHALFVAVLLVVITSAFGRAFYRAHIPSGTSLVQFLVMLVIGAASFCALGLAITAFVPNGDAAAPIVQATILPLLFISGIFIPFGNKTPSWIVWISKIFPVRHFALGMQAGYVGTPFHWSDVLIVAAWGLAGLIVAVRRFSWEPAR